MRRSDLRPLGGHVAPHFAVTLAHPYAPLTGDHSPRAAPDSTPRARGDPCAPGPLPAVRHCKLAHNVQEPAPLRSLHGGRSEEHTSELQSQSNIVCRLLLEKKKTPGGSD